jgi:PAS domain S-box-containing protein
MKMGSHPEMKKEISCRITRTLLMYVRETNSGSLGNLLEGVALDETYLSDVNNWVSHDVLQVLYERMVRLLDDEKAVYRMALASERFQSLGVLHRIARLLGSPRLSYLQAPKFNRFFKLNGIILIHEIGDSWVVLEDRYHDPGRKTRFDCDYTRGVLAGIPTVYGLPLAEIEEIRCQVAHDKNNRRKWPDNPPRGCEGCVYRVRWEDRKLSLIKRFIHRQLDRRKAVEDLVQANRLIQSKYDEVRHLAKDLEATNQQLVESKSALEYQKAKLTESEQKYRLLAEHISDTIWIMNLDTLKFEYVSPSIEKIRGFTPQEALALSIEETLSTRSLARVTEILETELANEKQPGVDPQRSRRLEVEHSLKGGGYAWAEITVSFIRGPNGVPTAILGVSRDISERKETEKIIAESEKKYRNLFENGSDLICIHDLEGNLLETNIPFKTEYGWSREELDGINIRDLIPPHYRDEFEGYMSRIITAGEDEGYLKTFTRTGEAVVLEYRNKLIVDEKGRPKAVQGAARDVTQRIQYEKALKESEEKYKTIVKHAPAGIFEMDLQRLKIISANDVMSTYTGYTTDELLELDPQSLLSEESKGKARQLAEKVTSGEKHPPPVECRIQGKNGREFQVITNSRIFFEDGAPKRSMTVVHDVTDIRKAEEEKRALEVKLQNARKLESLGTLAGGVAHDLNNILSGIISYPDLLLLDIDADSPLRQPLVKIKKSGEKAAEIVQDLLTLARRSVAVKKVLNPNQIIRDFIVSPEYNKIISEHRDISLQTHLTDGMLNLVGSETHVAKTVMNLVANAADAMPAGGRITISTRNCYVDEPHMGFENIPEGEYCIIEVSDRGIGIPPSELTSIFEPFYTKKLLGRSGTGLGMSVVWGTVKDHDGFIDIVSEEGSGTTFTLYFPASRSALEYPATVRIEDYIGKGESILVIDDAPEQRSLTSRMMRRLGYQVSDAESGEAAVEMVKDGTYDLLILDMIMPPGMDGLETYRRILEIAPGQRAVIASGYAETVRVHETQRLGAGGYIKKPFTLEKIGLAVRAELDRDVF